MLEDIRKRANGIDGKMPDANKAEIHRRDCIALLSLIDKYKEALETISAFEGYDKIGDLELYELPTVAKRALEKG